MCGYKLKKYFLPIIPLDEDGLLLDTLHSYTPTSLPVTVSVWM